MNCFFKKFKLNNYTMSSRQSVPFWIRLKSKKRNIIIKNNKSRTWYRGNAKV